MIQPKEPWTHARVGETWVLHAAAIVVLAAAGGAAATSRTATVHAVTSTTLGAKILVNARGFTLYHRTTEKRGTVNCIGSCRKSWPPLLVTSTKLVTGPGLTAKLGTIKRPDGGVQVTYNGYALYRYSGDKKAGQANGQGSGDVWYALTPAGVITKVTPKTRGTTPSQPSSGGTPTGPTSTAPTGTTTVDTIGCPPGESVAQGPEGGPNGASDDDDDNSGGPDDGDGCL